MLEESLQSDLDGRGLLRHTVCVGLRENKPARDVRARVLAMVEREKYGLPMTLVNMRKNGCALLSRHVSLAGTDRPT